MPRWQYMLIVTVNIYLYDYYHNFEKKAFFIPWNTQSNLFRIDLPKMDWYTGGMLYRGVHCWCYRNHDYRLFRDK